MTDVEGSVLLALARAAIADRLFAAGALAEAERAAPPCNALDELRGVFVTLKMPDDGGAFQLRGCIGSIEGSASLRRGVVDAAVSAAFADPRFAPLDAEEFPSVRLSVSALTALTRVERPDAIVAGEHGVLLESGRRRAVFLPQVATEQGWSTRTLLEHLARKAGLPADAWRRAELHIFHSENFEERRGTC